MEKTPNQTILNVLLLEDETLARWVARKSLEEAGAHVLEVESCAQAREQIDSHSFDLMVFDYRLPDGTGRDVVDYLRHKERSEPVIILSAETEQFPDPIRHKLNIIKVLTKPLNVDELQQAVQDYRQIFSQTEPETLDPQSGYQPTAKWVDRFHVHLLPASLTSPDLEQLTRSDTDKNWIALDCSQVTTFDPEIPTGIRDIANQCRAASGRLALIHVPDPLYAAFTQHNLLQEFDILQEERALEVLSRRLSSYCERSSLLDAIIPPPQESESAES